MKPGGCLVIPRKREKKKTSIIHQNKYQLRPHRNRLVLSSPLRNIRQLTFVIPKINIWKNKSHVPNHQPGKQVTTAKPLLCWIYSFFGGGETSTAHLSSLVFQGIVIWPEVSRFQIISDNHTMMDYCNR